GDHGDADVARRHSRNPTAKAGGVFEMRRRERRRLRRICKRDACNGSELFEASALVVAPQRTLGIEIDRDQDRDEQGEKGKTEFRTDTPRREPFSNAWGFQDRTRFSRASGERKRPRCAA